MSENTTETLIGGLVLAAAAVFLVFTFNTTSQQQSGGRMELFASFRSVEGISVGTDVRMAGVKIGAVTALALNPATYRAEARFSVPDSLELATDTQVLISSEGLLGGSFVEIVPGGAPDNLGDGDEIENTQGSISVITLLMKFVGGGNE